MNKSRKHRKKMRQMQLRFHRYRMKKNLQMLLGRERELERRRVLPVRTVAVREDTADAEVLARLQPGALYRVVYLDGEMRVRREIWENELLRSGKGK